MKRGFTVIEVLIAIVMLSVTAATVFPAVGWLIIKSRQLVYDAQAASVLQEGMEASYNVLLTGWDDMRAGRTYSPQVEFAGGEQRWAMTEGEEEVETRFTRGIQVGEVCRYNETGEQADCDDDDVTLDPESKLLTGKVSWTERGEDKVITATLLVVGL